MRLINLSEVMLRTGFRKTAIYSWIKDGTFPLPAKIGSSARWALEEIGDIRKTFIMLHSRSDVGKIFLPPQ
ncbi:TPA: AlpA family phage regulatory protein [Kluyvera ascorbata]|nr:AlpA family phage regulatory protein [Kluyvera ascorbata]